MNKAYHVFATLFILVIFFQLRVNAQDVVPLTILSPNGDERLEKGNTYALRWKGGADVNGVEIVLRMYKSGQPNRWLTVVTQTPNDGLYYYTIPKNFQETSWNLKLDIHTLDKKESDLSDNYFKIIPNDGIGSSQQALGVMEVIGIVEALYEVYNKAKSYYDAHISESLSSEEVHFNSLMAEMNDIYLKGVMADAISAIDFYATVSSINPKTAEDEIVINTLIGIAYRDANRAKNGILQEFKDENRPPEYSVKLAEVFSILTPILANIEQKWSTPLQDRQDHILQAFEAQNTLLGRPSGNNQYLPTYSRDSGKLFKAYKAGKINYDQYERLRKVLWNSQEFIKKSCNIEEHKKIFLIQGGLDESIVCLTRKGAGFKAEQGVLSKTADQFWNMQAMPVGYFKIKYINQCLTRDGDKINLQDCSDNSMNQLWEMYNGHLVSPPEVANINKRTFLKLNPDGSFSVKSGELTNFPTGSSFQFYNFENEHDNMGRFAGYKHTAIIGGHVSFGYQSQEFHCPLGMAAKGVVGASDKSSESLINFGIICAPYRSDWQEQDLSLESEEKLSSAVVLSLGTSATNGYITSPDGDPYWYYYNGLKSGTLSGGKPLEVSKKMCPNSLFINRFEMRKHPHCGYGGICALEKMICAEGELRSQEFFPQNWFGVPYNSHFRDLSFCPTADNRITGIRIWDSKTSVIGGFECFCNHIQSYQTITSLLGDPDGFGVGLKNGTILPVANGTIHNRESDDPPFTDESGTKFSYTHTFTLKFGDNIERAQFNFLSLGIQDGDHDVAGENHDLRMYIDGKEIPFAFDKVDQFGYNTAVSGWAVTAGRIYVTIPQDMLPCLSDGSVNVVIEDQNLGTGGLDSFAIDYSELIIVTSRK